MTEIEQVQTIGKRKQRLIVCCVLVLAGISSGWRLAARPMNGHEAFVSVTAREMLQNQDWIVPTFNGQVRLEKTPLNYWIVAAIANFSGKTDELTARIPSVFFAILSAAVILCFVNIQLGFRCGVTAALVCSLCYGFVRYSHSATAEMTLTCLILISLCSFYSAVTAQERKKQKLYAFIFWVSLSLAMLAKGPAPLPMVGVPVVLYFVVFRQWKKIPKLLPIAGVIIFLLIVGPWPVMVMNRLAEAAGETDTLAFWKREFVDRFLGTHDSGKKPIYYYLPLCFQFMLPWAGFVPMATAAPFYKIWGEKQKMMLFLWLWLAGIVGFMSLSGGKRMHYIFPAMPALAMLTGILLEDMVFARKAYIGRFARNLLLFHIGALLAFVIAAIFSTSSKARGVLPEVIVLATLTVIVIGVMTLLFAKNNNGWGFAAIFAGYCVVFMFAFTIQKSKNIYTLPDISHLHV